MATITKNRGLSPEFMHDLCNGFLNPILLMIKNDHTLLLQIRNDYINIYYRGGSIIKIQKQKGSYTFIFDPQYCNSVMGANSQALIGALPKSVSYEHTVNKWVCNVPILKQIMDNYFSKHLKCEREFQQLVARENNNSLISNETDYFITDIEYTNSNNRNAKFDFVAIKWPSISSDRKDGSNCRLVLIEMKYGDAAIGGKAGILKHIKDIESFCNDKSKLDDLKNETINAFKQLRVLGLIRFGKNGNPNQINELSDKNPEFIFLFANHKPVKGLLKSEFGRIYPLTNVDIKIATSSLMGYGLYAKNMVDLNNYKESL